MVRIDFHWKADANASGSDKAPWAILDPGMDWLIQEWHTDDENVGLYGDLRVRDLELGSAVSSED